MPTDDDRDAGNGSGESQQHAPGTTPTFSLDDVRTIVRETVQAALPKPEPRRAAAPVVEPEPDGATDEDYNTNLGAAVRKDLKRALHPIRQEMRNLQAFGLQRIGDLTQKVVSKDLPFYADFKAEIDGEVAKLEPALRTDPEVLRIVHNNVVALHVNEIQARARDEGARAARSELPAPSGNPGRAVGNDGKPVPEPSDIFGPEQCEEIERLGGPDRFAQRVTDGRCTDWKSYVERQNTFTAARAAKGSGLRGRVLVFPKLELKRGKIVGSEV